MSFLVENMKNKIHLIEKQNNVIIKTTNEIIQEKFNEMKKLIDISKENELILMNLDEKLKKKKEFIERIEEKMYSIPVLEQKIKFLHNEFELEKRKINDDFNRKKDSYEKILQLEKIKSFSLQENKKNINISCEENIFLKRHCKNLEKEFIRIKNLTKEQNDNHISFFLKNEY